jgi:hypothetical protein
MKAKVAKLRSRLAADAPTRNHKRPHAYFSWRAQAARDWAAIKYVMRAATASSHMHYVFVDIRLVWRGGPPELTEKQRPRTPERIGLTIVVLLAWG